MSNTPDRATLQIADLKRKPRAATRMTAVRVPVQILDAVAKLARELGALKTETVVALLNSAMDARGKTRR